MSISRYHLSPGTYLCLADGQVVLLDLRSDKYLALSEDASAILRPHIGPLGSRGGLENPASEPHLGAVLAQLSAKGLVCTADASTSTWETRLPLIRPDSAVAPRLPFRERAGARHMARYIASVLRAKSALRMRSLYQIVLTERRKALASSGGSTMFDPRRAAMLYSVYSRLRVIATGPRQCLFDSLALKLFLAHYDVFPDWVFGVRLNPFGAHCWLQHGSALVNDSLDSVRRFTPIMAV